MLRKDIPFSEEMQALLRDLATHVVVVGSVARGKPQPKDLDLIYFTGDEEMDVEDVEEAEGHVRAIIREHDISFESHWPGNWCFWDTNHDGVTQMIEILPFHDGRSYAECRRDGRMRQICGVELVVAPTEYAGPKL